MKIVSTLKIIDSEMGDQLVQQCLSTVDRSTGHGFLFLPNW